MSESETATSDAAREKWDAIGKPTFEPEGTAEPAEATSLATEEAAPPSPAPAADVEAQPDGSASEETVEVQPPPAATEAQPAAPSKAGEQPVPSTPDIKPFVPRVDGRELDLPGAFESGDYYVIRKDAWRSGVQPHLRHQSVWQARETEIRRQLETKSEGEVRATALLEHFAGLMEQGPDAVLDWLKNFESNKPLLERDLELAALKAKDGARTKEEQEGRSTAQAEAYARWKPGALKGALAEVLASPEFKDAGLDEKALLDKLEILGDEAFFQADDDMPEWGVRKGQIGVRYDRIYKLAKADAALVKGLRTTMQETQKAKETNKAAVGESKAPPTVSAKGSPTLGGKEKTLPKSGAEWEAQLAEKNRQTALKARNG